MSILCRTSLLELDTASNGTGVSGVAVHSKLKPHLGAFRAFVEERGLGTSEDVFCVETPEGDVVFHTTVEIARRVREQAKGNLLSREPILKKRGELDHSKLMAQVHAMFEKLSQGDGKNQELISHYPSLMALGPDQFLNEVLRLYFFVQAADQSGLPLEAKFLQLRVAFSDALEDLINESKGILGCPFLDISEAFIAYWHGLNTVAVSGSH